MEESTDTSLYRKLHSRALRGAGTVAMIALAVVGGWYYLPHFSSTIAYFGDTEASRNNLFAATTLDITAQGDDASDIKCGGEAVFLAYVTLVSSRYSSYEAHAEFAGGSAELCDALDVTALLNGSEVFEGDLLALIADVEVASSSDEWQFDVRLPGSAKHIPDGATCTVDIVFRAWCASAGDFGEAGFSDEDKITLTLTKQGCKDDGCPPDDGKPCTACGDITIISSTTNIADITNTVISNATSGGNSASGGSGGDGGSAKGGKGGTGGDGGSGGTVVTGNASSSVSIENIVNTTITNITVGSGTATSGSTTTSGSSLRDTILGAVQDRLQSFIRTR